MRVLTFTELTSEYAVTTSGFDADDIVQRNINTDKFPYSVIVEGEWSELENLEKWMIQTIDEAPPEQIWYGKTGYDFGCVEYFLVKEENALRLQTTVPKIYTIYPHSLQPGTAMKSEGYDNMIAYDPQKGNDAIIF